MSRAIQKEQRDNVRITKTADALILTNERTGESVSVPPNAAAWERRAAIKQLQPARDTTYDQPLVPKSAAKPDKPLPVPTTPGILARKRAQENAEYERQREQERQRRREIEDRKALASDIIEGLKGSAAAVESEPAPVNLGDEYRRRMETTLNLSRVRRDSNSTPEQIAAAESANREAWGFVAEGSDDAE